MTENVKDRNVWFHVFKNEILKIESVAKLCKNNTDGVRADTCNEFKGFFAEIMKPTAHEQDEAFLFSDNSAQASYLPKVSLCGLN
eukprot:CAMPEP_0204837802 /NCGR_PEP_ID=MMETSP1346-20131115/29041_1 /ASSEMBLY_ACC=CAM_ASM_000771 /TAXON_ID=215587 /ORGANISM="Aplanochytrium stocchinoi, Strain GSBS06" /LENGTH=84 /DNA_ID=CAMNT_0051973471 /DNA_START=100 /DNA_END=351 /DNA_ORIENTATION=-